MIRTRIARLALTALIAGMMVTGACAAEDLTLAGMVRDPLPSVGTVSLPDASQGGTEFATIAEEGHILVLYFGYTNCPDVCPTTMADLRRAVATLGDDATKIDVAMVSVDPARDDGERLTAYIQSFFSDGHSLRTDDPARLEEAAFAFGAAYEVTETEDGNIDVAHSAFLYAIDPAGYIQVQWPFGMTSEDIASDLEQLLRRLT